MKILIVAPSLPYPADTGANIRVYNLIKNLSKNNEVHIISIIDKEINQNNIDEIKKYCCKIYTAKLKKCSKLFQVPMVIKRFLNRQPFMLKYTESNELKKLLKSINNKDGYDIIQFEHSYMAQNVLFLSSNLRSKKIIDFHNIACAQYYRVYKVEKRLYEKIKYFLEWFPMFHWEPMIAEYFDKSITVSEMDKFLLQFLNPNLDISVIPNGVDLSFYLPIELNERERNLLIIGSLDYRPNVDAVQYFYKEIFPIVKKRLPFLKLIIVGRRPPLEIKRLTQDNSVIVQGDVMDIRPFYKKGMVSLVPLRSGGGSRLKILEAMATGTPVVSTNLGCEGLNVENNYNILIGKDKNDFATKIIELFLSMDLWNQISKRGREFVESNFDWMGLSNKLQEIYLEVLKK